VSTPEPWRPPDRVVREHKEWWADHVERRMLGNVRRAKGYKTGPPKEVWNRAQFVRGLVAAAPDYPAAELADKFEQAIAEARGNPASFRRRLEELLG
jgi:hypothetical protein